MTGPTVHMTRPDLTWLLAPRRQALSITPTLQGKERLADSTFSNTLRRLQEPHPHTGGYLGAIWCPHLPRSCFTHVSASGTLASSTATVLKCTSQESSSKEGLGFPIDRRT